MRHLHTAEILRPGASTVRPGGARRPGAPALVATTECTITPRGGRYDQQPVGREVQGAFVGFFPAGTDVKEGDFIRPVGAGGHIPRALLVRFIGDWGEGEGWDVEADLDTTETALP